MRIVHQILSAEVAGGQRVALAIARGTREAGHEPVFFSPLPGPFLESAAAEGFTCRVVPLRDALRIDDAVRLAHALRDERAEIVHTHAHFSVNVLARMAGRAARVPVVAHMHTDNVFRSGNSRRAQVIVDNLTARLCARIVAVSDATRRALEAQGYPPRLLETLHTGIEPLPVERDPALRASLGVPADAPLILSVGRLSETKGHLDLVRALAHLDGVWAVVAGEDVESGGAFTRALLGEAARLGVAGRLVLAGRRDDVPALLASADLLVLPSWVEGLPLVVLEAMAAARPVVATSVGGVPELVADGETGLLVPPRDPEALARAVEAALADGSRLGAAGRRRVEQRFSFARMIDRMLAIYAGVTR